jgi:hypothetical protein
MTDTITSPLVIDELITLDLRSRHAATAAGVI